VKWLRRPSWFALLLTVAGALLFIRLGVWQLHRADEKEQVLRRYAAAENALPSNFAAVAEKPPVDAFARVKVQGNYLAERLYLLDNPKHDQRGGVEVYAAFRPQGGDRLLLVDLGFLPGNGTDQTPQIPPLPEGRQDLQGLYLPPPSRPDKPLAMKTLIIPTSEYVEGRNVILTTANSVYTVALRHLVEQRPDWCWVTIQIVEKTPRES